jgi:phosphoribosyl-dephospho-CoA transferase
MDLAMAAQTAWSTSKMRSMTSRTGEAAMIVSRASDERLQKLLVEMPSHHPSMRIRLPGEM